MPTNRFRRLTACLLLLTLLFGLTASHAEVNLSSMTDEEITALLADVTAEVARRGIEKTAVLPKGAYLTGRDLPAGRYLYTCLASGNEWGNVTVYADKGKGSQLLWEVVSAPEAGQNPDTIYLILKDGDELKSGVPFSLQIMTGVLFQ